jgi:hypothetical protein
MTVRLQLVQEKRWCCMTPTERPISHKVLLVDDDEAVRHMMTATLARKRFGVIAVPN